MQRVMSACFGFEATNEESTRLLQLDDSLCNNISVVHKYLVEIDNLHFLNA